MAKMNAVKIGAVPDSAKSNGTLNDTLPAAERNPETPELTQGPQKGEFGEFQPAAYEVEPGLVRVDR